MEIKLYTTYASMWDNIQYPIYELNDGSYICITYSSNHRVYHINTYTKEEFEEQGFEEYTEYNYLFEDVTSEMLSLI